MQSAGQCHLGPELSRRLRPTGARLCTGTNPHDVFSMSLHLDANDPMLEAKTQALRKRGLGAHTIFPLRMSGLPNSILQMAAFLEAQPESPEEVEELADYLLDKVGGAARHGRQMRSSRVDPVCGAAGGPVIGAAHELAEGCWTLVDALAGLQLAVGAAVSHHACGHSAAQWSRYLLGAATVCQCGLAGQTLLRCCADHVARYLCLCRVSFLAWTAWTRNSLAQKWCALP